MGKDKDPSHDGVGQHKVYKKNTQVNSKKYMKWYT